MSSPETELKMEKICSEVYLQNGLQNMKAIYVLLILFFVMTIFYLIFTFSCFKYVHNEKYCVHILLKLVKSYIVEKTLD